MLRGRNEPVTAIRLLAACVVVAAMSGTTPSSFAESKKPPEKPAGKAATLTRKITNPPTAATLTAPIGTSALALSAVVGADDKPILAGLVWRLFSIEADGTSLTLAKVTSDGSPVLSLPAGDYLAHVSYGLGSATKRITLTNKGATERLSLAVGGLMVSGTIEDRPIDAKDLQISVFIPSEINSEERLMTDKLKVGEVIRLPEGTYHIVSTYGGSNASVRADIEVKTGKAVDVRMKHRAARITLKLVSKAGGEALTNTEWTVLTPGGDVVREDLGAFSSMVLAEGSYTAIARHDGQTYVGDIKIVSGNDREFEVLAVKPQ
jgi:hypothetical protein